MRFLSQFLGLVLAGILLFPTSCAHRLHRTPISVPSAGMICEKTREYVSVLDSTTPEERAALEEALAEINSVIPGLVHYKGTVKNASEAYDQHLMGVNTVMGHPQRWNPKNKEEAAANKGTLAVTVMALEPPIRRCLPPTPIIILADLSKLSSPEHLKMVMLHEVVHSLGFDHASPFSEIPTVMKPNISKVPLTHLTDADKASIRAVYGH